MIMSIKCISKNCPFSDTDHENCHFIDCCDFAVEQPTNADRIRAMTDDELNELFHDIYNAGAEDAVAYEWGQRTYSFEWTIDWLQQPPKGE